MRNARNRAGICSDIFACRPVAARCRLHEQAVFIPQRQAQTVNLGLRGKAQAGLGNPQKLGRSRDKIVDIRVFKSIAQRKHRLRMRHFGKPVRRCSPDFLARAVRALQLGKARFNRSVTLFQAVVLGIRNLWRILSVIRRVGRSQRLGQPRKLVPRCGLSQSVNVLLCHTRPQVFRFVAAYMPQVCPLCQCAATQKKTAKHTQQTDAQTEKGAVENHCASQEKLSLKLMRQARSECHPRRLAVDHAKHSHGPRPSRCSSHHPWHWPVFCATCR